jgi:hypothetical protein
MRACYACGAVLDEKLEVHRTTECPSCRRDLHVCRNCTFYAPGSHWDCAETVPECVVDKERSNFCDYFRYRIGPPPSASTDKSGETRKRLDRLFGG